MPAGIEFLRRQQSWNRGKQMLCGNFDGRVLPWFMIVKAHFFVRELICHWPQTTHRNVTNTVTWKPSAIDRPYLPLLNILEDVRIQQWQIRSFLLLPIYYGRFYLKYNLIDWLIDFKMLKLFVSTYYAYESYFMLKSFAAITHQTEISASYHGHDLTGTCLVVGLPDSPCGRVDR